MTLPKYNLFQIFVRKSKSPLFETAISTYSAAQAYHYASEAIEDIHVAEICFRKNDPEMNVVFQSFEDARGKDKIDGSAVP